MTCYDFIFYRRILLYRGFQCASVCIPSYRSSSLVNISVDSCTSQLREACLWISWLLSFFSHIRWDVSVHHLFYLLLLRLCKNKAHQVLVAVNSFVWRVSPPSPLLSFNDFTILISTFVIFSSILVDNDDCCFRFGGKVTLVPHWGPWLVSNYWRSESYSFFVWMYKAIKSKAVFLRRICEGVFLWSSQWHSVYSELRDVVNQFVGRCQQTRVPGISRLLCCTLPYLENKSSQ